MTYISSSGNSGTAPHLTIRQNIQTAGQAAGWTMTLNSPSSGIDTYVSPTVSGATITIEANWNAASYVSFVEKNATASSTLYLWHGTTGVASSIIMDTWYIAIHDQTFFLSMAGPQAGQTYAADGSYGSSRGYFFATTVKPYFASDTTASDRIVIGSSHASASITGYSRLVYVRVGRNATNWATAELGSVFPLNNGNIGAAGYRFDSNQVTGSVPFWPLVLVETASGLRGRLENLFFLAQTDTAGSDGAIDTTWQLTSMNKQYRIVGPFFAPNQAAQYCSLGVPTRTTAQTSTSFKGGPYILVRGEV
jgi:hypothetical protein